MQTDAEWLLAHHLILGEPLDAEEVQAIVDGCAAKAPDFEDRGGGLYWYVCGEDE